MYLGELEINNGFETREITAKPGDCIFKQSKEN